MTEYTDDECSETDEPTKSMSESTDNDCSLTDEPTMEPSTGSVPYTTIYSDNESSVITEEPTMSETTETTSCPVCTHEWSSGTHTTIYTTEYEAIGSTGLVNATYTITESCTDAEPSWNTGESDMPPGFTKKETVCTVCGSEPVTTSMVVPCSSECDNSMSSMSGSDPGPLTSDSMTYGSSVTTTTTATVCYVTDSAGAYIPCASPPMNDGPEYSMATTTTRELCPDADCEEHTEEGHSSMGTMTIKESCPGTNCEEHTGEGHSSMGTMTSKEPCTGTECVEHTSDWHSSMGSGTTKVPCSDSDCTEPTHGSASGSAAPSPSSPTYSDSAEAREASFALCVLVVAGIAAYAFLQ